MFNKTEKNFKPHRFCNNWKIILQWLCSKSVTTNPRDHLQASYNLDSELKSEYVGQNHSNLNEFPKIAEISLKNAKISKIIGNC